MLKPIRILHVIGIMNRGGAESFIMNLYRAIDRSLVQFDFVEGSNQPASYDSEIMDLGGRVYRCPRFNGKNIISYRKWWNDFFKEHASDYVAVHGHIGSTAAIYLSIAKKYGLHTIAHSHNTYSGFSVSQLAYRALSYPTRYIADDLYTCSTEAGISRYGNRREIELVRNGIDTISFSYDKEKRNSIRKELNIPEDCYVFGHVGRFAEQKNHKKIIGIFNSIHKKKPNTKLLLVGDGKLRNEIKELVKNYSLDDAVVFTGVRSDINALMCAMDLMLFPSLFEGLPVTLVEAQCTGLKCLVSDVISKETVLNKNLVIFKQLEESDESWAEQALQLIGYIREDGSMIVRQAGFDIQDIAKNLQNKYLKMGNNHE